MNENIDFLAPFTREEYEELRRRFPEDGTEYSQWQKLPKLPEENKVVITFDDSHIESQIEFDELCFRTEINEENGIEHAFWRHHYFWDKVNTDIHYWKYAPDDPPEDNGYNVGD